MAGSKTRGKYLKPEAWRALMTRFGASGLSVAEFCRRESLCKASFYRWRGLLGRVVEADQPNEVEPGGSGFVDLGMLGQSATAATVAKSDTASNPLGSLELTLELGGGLVLHLVRG